MSTVQILGLITVLLAPYLLVATLGWTAYRRGYLRLSRDQFSAAAPMVGRLAGSDMGRLAGSHDADDRDGPRVRHDFDAVRTRFERRPSWPTSGAVGERR